MNTSKLLTVIVPTYNMETYLSRGLDSLIVDEHLLRQIEVLVVNDGSTDNSSKIAHQYQNKYPDTFIVIDKENGNYGSAINRGLQAATGKYVRIMDADDWYDTTVLTQFVVELSHLPEVDMILNDYQMVSADGNVIKNITYSLPYGITSFQEYCEKEYFAMPSITYRTQLLRDINYKQTEGISYTDNQWMYYPQCYVDKCLYADNNLYRYFWGRDGQTTSSQVRRNANPVIIKLLKNMILFAEEVPANLKNNEGYKRLIDFICHTSKGIYKDYLVNSNRDNYTMTNYDELKKFDDYIAQHNQVIYYGIEEKAHLKVFHINYIKYWRKHDKRIPIDFLRDSYRKIRYGKDYSKKC